MSSMETEKGTTPPPPAPSAAATTMTTSSCKKCNIMVDVFLRVLLLAASIVAVVVMVTSKQTEMIPVPNPPIPGLTAPVPAKFNNSPAFIYLVVALSVAGLYSIITGVASLAVLGKPNFQAKMMLILITHDVLILGIVAAATGTAGGVGYIGLKGNTHVRWDKICHVYDKFCRHLGSSIAMSLVASVVLVVLILLNAISLYRRIPGCSTC